MRGPRRAPPLLFLALLVAGCELRDVTTAAPADMVIAEVVLVAGHAVQRAFLHRTLGVDGDSVPGARVEVHAADGRVMRFRATDIGGVCTVPGARGGTCYLSVDSTVFEVEHGARYRLEIELADGGRMHATTTVPGAFEFIQPRAGTPACSVPPGSQLELTWSRSLDAGVYLVEADFGSSLAGAFPEIEPPDPFRTVGLSVGGADTTLVLPAELGVFDRFDEQATATLVALQRGLPRESVADVVVAAAEQNYVNWVRGGSFNPSGIVRIASVRGDGTGVFGALALRGFRVHGSSDGSGADHPSCFR